MKGCCRFKIFLICFIRIKKFTFLKCTVLHILTNIYSHVTTTTIKNIFITLWSSSRVLYSHHFPQPPASGNHGFAFCPYVLSLQECRINRITQNIVFGVWLLSLNIMLFDSSVLPRVSAPFYFWVVFHCLFICSAVEGHLGCFQFWAIMNKATVNIHEQLFVWT